MIKLKILMQKIGKLLLTDIIPWSKDKRADIKDNKRADIIDRVFTGEFFKNLTIIRVDFTQTTIPHFNDKLHTVSVTCLNGRTTIKLTEHSLTVIVDGLRVDIFDYAMLYQPHDVTKVINQFITKIEDDTGVCFDELTMGCMSICE